MFCLINSMHLPSFPYSQQWMLALGAVSKMLPRIDIIHIPNSIDIETEIATHK